MHIFKENLHHFSFFLNVSNDPYKLSSKLLYIVNISSFKKEQLKLHRSFLGVKE